VSARSAQVAAGQLMLQLAELLTSRSVRLRSDGDFGAAKEESRR
jgi:hypothetical protein